ncbi:MAG: transglutaminase domain-containing protein [Gemmatimonadetes bacterium]|nr:transglutaminase domain-containing protein [Gemmatimonadota bacterium]
MSRRAVTAGVILLAWVAGLGVLARRELFKGSGQRLAELALRISPETFYYVVEQGGAQVGFASSAIDTTSGGILVKDAFSADLAVAGQVHRATAQSEVRLSRGMVLRGFTVQFAADSQPVTVTGSAEGDSAIRFAVTTGGGAPEAQRVKVNGPVLLPTLVPLAMALGEVPQVGRRFTIPLFDPSAMGTRDVVVSIRAESLFVVPDSAALDSASGRWHVVHSDTVRAWQIGSDDRRYLSGWIDERGRLVESAQAGGFVLRRTAFEVAFENWRTAQMAASAASRPNRDRDILDATAIGAGVRLGGALGALKVRLRAPSLEGFDLDGGRQLLAGNLLSVRRETRDELAAGAPAIPTGAILVNRFRRELAEEPLLQVNDPAVAALARRIAGEATDKGVIAERLVRWVFDSLRKEVTVSVPDARRVLALRAGDCNEHTQLYVALARAVQLPARIASGLAYVDGRFYFHAWPEVFLGSWVAVDPTFGQFPADAAHLRFVTGGLARQAALLRLIGTLEIDVLEPAPARAGAAGATRTSRGTP